MEKIAKQRSLNPKIGDDWEQDTWRDKYKIYETEKKKW